MKLIKIDNYIFNFLLFISAILLIYIAVFSDVHFSGSESIYHYFHSRAIFKHPEVMINHWGKPLFILLSAPFAYFGETGAKIFNVLVMLLSAIFVFKIGKILNFKYAFPAIFLVLFSPIYLRFSQSALTEPLFGLVAVFSAYLFLNKKYIISSIVVSFILFARSEGMLFLLLYAFAFIVKRQYKALPYLLTGFVLYGILGIIFNHGFLWFYTDYPYNGAVDIYGKGPFWNYFINQEYISGTPFSIAIVLGFVLLFYKTLKEFAERNIGNLVLVLFSVVFSVFLCFFIKNNGIENPFSLAFLILDLILIGSIKILLISSSEKRATFKNNFIQNMPLNILIILPAFIYIFAHSLLWFMGMGSALGLYRIVGAVFPLLAILALFGMNIIVSFISKIPKIGNLCSIAFLLFYGVIMISFTYKDSNHIILVQPDVKEKMILNTISFIKDNDLEKRKMYVFQAHYISAFNGDHFAGDKSQIINGLSKPYDPKICTEIGDLIIWDGQNSPNEGRLPIENLEHNANFKELKMFRPTHEFKVLGGGYYYIKIFERI